MPHLDVTELPDELSWIIAKLSPTEFRMGQPFITDSGHVISPQGPRVKGLAGTVTLSPRQYQLLQSLMQAPVSVYAVADPVTKKRLLLSPWTPPHMRRESSENGIPKSFDVSFELAVQEV